MPQRTVERVTGKLAAHKEMAERPRGRRPPTPATQFCKAVCIELCNARDRLVTLLYDRFPAGTESILRESTDLKTLIDMYRGASCDCTCEPPSRKLPEKEETED